MDVMLITAGIKASLRAAQAGIDLYVERATDNAIFLPDIQLPPATIVDNITHFLRDNPEYQQQPPFAVGWENNNPFWLPENEQNMQDCMAKYLQAKAAPELTDLTDDEKNQLIGGRIVEQWRHSKQPPTVWARLALTLTDIGLEFIVTNPSIMGEQSKGESLILAFSNNLSKLIPDDVSDMGERHDFENRLLGVFLRAGLTTLVEDPSKVIEDEDVEALVLGIVTPIQKALPQSFNQQMQYRAIVEVFLNESAASAFSVIANKQQRFLGDGFANDKALGAVTQALLLTTADISATEDITRILSKDGVVALFTSVLNVANSQPHLFIDGSSGDEHNPLVVKLFSDTAGIIQENINDGFNRNMAVSLATMVIDTFAVHAEVILKLDSTKAWQSVAIDIVKYVSSNVSHALANNQRFQLLSKPQQLEYIRIILFQMADTPEMLGSRNQELNRIIAGVAEMMAADESLLISNDDWLRIAATVAKMAADNPQRLFSIDATSDAQQFAVKVIKQALNVASEALANNPRSALRGQTLADALMTIVESLAGDITALIDTEALVTQYLEALTTEILEHPMAWGSEAIISYIEATIQSVLATGQLPSFNQ